MFRTTATLHFDPEGNPITIAVELFETTRYDRVACCVSPVGPFDDPDEVYRRAWEGAFASATKQLPGQQSMNPQAHPRVALRRATDPKEARAS